MSTRLPRLHGVFYIVVGASAGFIWMNALEHLRALDARCGALDLDWRARVLALHVDDVFLNFHFVLQEFDIRER